MTWCPDCSKRWTGLNMAHCASCCETFSTVGNFDKHRSGKMVGDRRMFAGQCLKPAEAGLVQNSRGTWITPGEKDVTEWLHKTPLS